MALIDQLDSKILKEINEFALNLEWARRLPPYEIHKWWAKRLAGVISLMLSFAQIDKLEPEASPREIIEKLFFDPPHSSWKLLDPFAGSGVIPLEATRHGMNSYAIEIDPLAFRILNTYNLLSENALRNLKESLKVAAKKTEKHWTYKCPRCGGRATIIFVATTPPPDLVPQFLEMYCKKCKYRGILSADEKIKEIFSRKGGLGGERTIPDGKELRRIKRNGFNSILELVHPHVLNAYKVFLEECKKRGVEDLGAIAVSSAIPSTSYLAYYSKKWKKIIPTMSIKGLWVPKKDSVIQNPLAFKANKDKIYPMGRSNISSAVRKLERALFFMKEYNYHPENMKTYLGDSLKILGSLDVNFDIVFTDPPYFDLIEYEELSYPFRKILESLGIRLEEAFEGYLVAHKKKDKETFFRKLTKIFLLIKQRTKKNAPILLTFHHPDQEIMRNFLEATQKAGLYLTAVYSVAGESSGGLIKNHITIDGLFVLRKHKPKEVNCQIVKFKKPKGTYTSKDIEFIHILKELAEEFSQK